MNPNVLKVIFVVALAALAACNDGAPFARAYRITNRAQIIGGVAALADLNDFILENDKIRLAFPEPGNSTGAGVFGGSLMDADLYRPQAKYRAGRGMDQFGELFPISNLAIPAVCVRDREKYAGFCERLPRGVRPSVTILCDGQTPCVLDASEDVNADYAFEGAMPSPQAAILRVEGPAGNYLEVLGLVKLAGVKMNFRIRADYILEPGESYVRMRTLIQETRPDGSVVPGELIPMPPVMRPTALFGILLGSELFDTELPDLEPGIAGGEFLFFGRRLGVFAPGVGFDIYKEIRNKFAVGDDPFNNPISGNFIAGVGDEVSYAIASAEAGGQFLLPLYSDSVTAIITHAASCHAGPCPGTTEQCANVIDCTGISRYFFEQVFAVGAGDVASATAPVYKAWGIPTGEVKGHVYDRRTGQPVPRADVHVFPVPATMADCRPGLDPSVANRPYEHGAAGFAEKCLEPRFFMGAVNHFRTDRGATDMPEGAFEGVLPTGRYYLLAKKEYFPASQVVEIQVTEGTTTHVNLHLLPPATVSYEVRDEKNQQVPAKLTVGQCFPNCSGRVEGTCEQDPDCVSGKCIEHQGSMTCLIDNCPADRVCDLAQRRCVTRAACSSDDDCEPVERCVSLPGSTDRRCHCVTSFERWAALGEGSYPAGFGRYAYTSDGYGAIDIEPGSYEILTSRGFEYSIDRHQVALVPGQAAHINARLIREVDTSGWISGDYHVHGQNSYDGVVKNRDRVIAFAGEGVELLCTTDHDYILDLQPYVHEMGLERWVKTEVGLEMTTVELGHILGFPFKYEEWRDGERVQEQGAIDWTGMTFDQIFTEMKALGRYSPEDTVITVAHPRDSFMGYFDQFGLNPYDLSVEGSMLEWLPGINTNPLADPELFSGRFDAIELFNSKAFDLIRTPTSGEMRAYNLARKAIQAKSEQGASPSVVEQELIALDRLFIKDILERTPEEQDAIWESDGTDGCEMLTFCTGDDDCDGGQRCDRGGTSACYVPCATDAECGGTGCIDGKCDPGFPSGDSPCTSHEGVVDDWFRLLDYGVARTGMGNSDTHKLFTQTEAGIPRNFVRVSAEMPKSIDPLEMTRNINGMRVVASYGPFVEVWLGDKEVGQTLTASPGDSVRLRIRVQSPSWFDVDRVEVYQSGRLVHVFTGQGDELDPQSPVNVSGLKLPNPGIVNLDAALDVQVPDRDAWFVVIAMGLEGRDMSPVYGEHPYMKIPVGDILSMSFSSIALMDSFGITGVIMPRTFRVYPYAVANPVFLDVDGNGRYDAPHDPPDWAEGGRTTRSRSVPLSSARISGSPLAPEPDWEAFRLSQLKHFMSLLKQATLYGARTR